MNQQEREHLINEAELGTRGAGGIVKSLFVLDDSINALEKISTKLNRILVWLTAISLLLTFVIVGDICRIAGG